MSQSHVTIEHGGNFQINNIITIYLTYVNLKDNI